MLKRFGYILGGTALVLFVAGGAWFAPDLRRYFRIKRM